MKGRDKLLETIEGIPLLRRQTLAALTSGCPVAVMLPTGSEARRAAVSDMPIHVELVPDAEEGIAASLRRAAALLAKDQPLGLLLPDVPGITGADVCTVLEAFRDAGGDRAVRATDTGGRPGTPLFLPHRIARKFAGLSGDTGGRSILVEENVKLVRFPDDRATVDLDTPEAWQAWRAATGWLD